jgi:hypothetical protein
MGTITSKILTQLQRNAEDTKTKTHNLLYEVKSTERGFSNFVFIDDINISAYRDVSKKIQEDHQ